MLPKKSYKQNIFIQLQNEVTQKGGLRCHSFTSESNTTKCYVVKVK